VAATPFVFDTAATIEAALKAINSSSLIQRTKDEQEFESKLFFLTV
jgi:hypothetical protein